MEHAAPMSDLARNANEQGHGSAEGFNKARKQSPAVCPTDGEAAVTPKRKTQSLDYVWRSGVAGGFAGSAVSATSTRRDQSIRVQCFLTLFP